MQRSKKEEEKKSNDLPMAMQNTGETLLFISLTEFQSYNLFLYHGKLRAIWMLLSVEKVQRLNASTT